MHSLALDADLLLCDEVLDDHVCHLVTVCIPGAAGDKVQGTDYDCAPILSQGDAMLEVPQQEEVQVAA
jgi:hypothetical protein